LLNDFFDAAQGNWSASDFRDALASFAKGSLHGCLDHALLQFIRKRACRQLQRFIQGMDALRAGPVVAQARDLDGTKDGLQHAHRQTPAGVASWLVAILGHA
jgi:hypothetical protein